MLAANNFFLMVLLQVGIYFLFGCAQKDEFETGDLKSIFALHDPLPGKMYEYVVKSQIKNDANSRHDGAWLTDAYLGFIHVSGTDSFKTLQIALALQGAGEFIELPGVEDVHAKVATLMTDYLSDAEATGEPKGTINYWAAYEYKGSLVHYLREPNLPGGLQNKWDIPNELDSSSQLFLWSEKQENFSEFGPAYVAQVANWVDEGRSRQHPNEDRWKNIDSHAFLTWSEPRSGEANRIPKGVNEVDCVVNLNVLHSLYQASLRGEMLSEATLAAREKSCDLMVKMIEERTFDRCSIYYDKTHVLYAAAKAIHGGVSCLQPVASILNQEVLIGLNRQAKKAQLDSLDVVETVLAAKFLNPASERSPTLSQQIAKMLAKMRTMVKADGGLPLGFAYQGTNSLDFTGTFHSRGLPTALGVQALVVP